MSRRVVEVVVAGALSTVQDLGRPGLAELGIGTSGAADRVSFELANRLVGNERSAAGIEVTFGGLTVRAHGTLLLAVTGAPCPLTVARGPGGGMNAPFYIHDGDRLVFGQPRSGLRSYLAVRGGIDSASVLGSRSADLLAGIGPDPLSGGEHLGVGDEVAEDPPVDVAAVAEPTAGVIDLAVVPGPRDDWFVPDALAKLTAAPYEVSSESNRIGMRLQGYELARARAEELPSEGMVPGSVQVPPSGQPTVLLADHPVTGGYPVLAVVLRADVDRAAQARPGQLVRFHVAGRPAPSAITVS